MVDTPLPKERDFCREVEGGIKYQIKINTTANSIHLVVCKEGKLPRKRFEIKYNYEELTKKAKWFCLFDSLIPISAELGNIFNEKKYTLKEESDKITISLQLNLRYIQEPVLVIPEFESKTEEIIQDLCYSMNQMQVTLKAMKENMEIVELSPLYKAMFEKGKLIKENKVLSDAQFMETIKQKISPDIVKFNLLYSATQDGDSCTAFHFNCDGKGPTFVVITTAKNYIFGGYIDVNWDQSGAYRNSLKAFLFS